MILPFLSRVQAAFAVRALIRVCLICRIVLFIGCAAEAGKKPLCARLIGICRRSLVLPMLN